MPDHISPTMISTFLMCPRKYRFRYIDQLEPERKSAAMALGSAVHSAISWWQSKRREGVEAKTEDACRIYRADWASGLAGDDLDLEGENPEEMRAQGEALVRLFVERFKDEIPDAVDVPVEATLIHPRTGEELPVPLVGFLDYAVDDVVCELKTTARRTNPSQWNLQLSAYTYAVAQQTGRRPKVRVVELVKTQKPPFRPAPDLLTRLLSHPRAPPGLTSWPRVHLLLPSLGARHSQDRPSRPSSPPPRPPAA